MAPSPSPAWSTKASKVAKSVLAICKDLDQTGDEAAATLQSLAGKEPSTELLAAAAEAITGIAMGPSEDALLKKLRPLLLAAKDIVKLLQEAGDEEAKGTAMMAVAAVQILRVPEPDAPVAALRAATEAYEIIKRTGDQKRTLQTLRLLMMSYAAKGATTPFDDARREAFTKAAEYGQEVMQLYRASGDQQGEAEALLEQAKSFLSLEDEDCWMEAEVCAEEAVSLYKDLNSQSQEWTALQALVEIRLKLSGPEEGIRTLKEASNELKRGGTSKKNQAALALQLAAELSAELKNFGQAMSMAQEALDTFQKGNDRLKEASVMHTMMVIHCGMNDMEKAIATGDQALDIFKRIGESAKEAATLSLMAKIQFEKLQDEVEADTLADKKVDDPPHGLTTEDVFRRGREAIDLADRAVKIYEDRKDQAGAESVQEMVAAAYDRATEFFKGQERPTEVKHIMDKHGRKIEDTQYKWDLEEFIPYYKVQAPAPEAEAPKAE